MSSELVIGVCQNVISSEYQNFCCVKILDCCVGILDGKFLCKEFFSSIFYGRQFFLLFFLCKHFLMIFDTPSPGNLLMVRP